MSAKDESDSDMCGNTSETSAACIDNINNGTPSDVPKSSASKKARLKEAIRKLAIEIEMDVSGAKQMETTTISKTIHSTEASKEQSSLAGSETKSPEKLAPAPPRWRFVNEAKSTLGYSSKHAGVFVSGRSSTELGAEYVAPEITKDVKVRTIERFDLVAPDENCPEPEKEKEVGRFTIREWDKKTEDFNGDGGLCHRLETPSLPIPYSKMWKPNCAQTPGVPPFAREDGGESFGYEHDLTPFPQDLPQFDYPPPSDDTPIETNRVVGKLKFNPRDDKCEEFNGEIPKRKLSSAENDEGGNDEFVENMKPTHLYLDSSMTTTGVAPSDGAGTSADNHYEPIDRLDDLHDNEKPISLHSIPGRQRNLKRCCWLLLPLLLMAIITGAIVGKKRSSKGIETASIITAGFVGVNDTGWPSQSPTVFLDPAHADTDPLFARPKFPPTYQPSLIPSITPLPSASPSILDADPLFARPTFPPTYQPLLIPSITPLPSASPSIVSSISPSGETSFNTTEKPIILPSFDPTFVPSTISTSDPSMSLSSRPSASPLQLQSKSGEPTIIGSVEPSLSIEPTPSPSNHPMTTSPSKQPITFMGGCPAPFEPFTPYINGTKVSRDGVIYMCISTNCGSLTYAPGGLSSDQWRDTWAIVGSCNGTNSPTLAPFQSPSTTPTEIPSTTISPTLQPIIFIGGCTEAFNPFGSYATGSIISFEGIVYECIYPVCESGLVPGDFEAWKVVGSCNGTIAPTSKPSAVPSIMVTDTPSILPTPAPFAEPSLSPTKMPTIKPVVVPTPMPTCPPQNGNFNLCIALDMSGSVCGGGECLLCEPMSSCNSFGINQQRCCNNFDNVLEFSKALVGELGALKTQQDFSLIHFATDAEIASTLQNANQAIKTLQQLQYTGGRTHLGAGITLCQRTLNSSTAGRKNLMLVVTDGYPSQPTDNAREVAVQAAIDAKNKGTHIIPIFIEQADSNDPEAVELMKEISSDTHVFLTDFDSIVSLKDTIFEQVICHT
ncbi:hypothetical protein ACHAXM_011148 [Skeletonema potamos]